MSWVLRFSAQTLTVAIYHTLSHPNFTGAPNWHPRPKLGSIATDARQAFGLRGNPVNALAGTRLFDCSHLPGCLGSLGGPLMQFYAKETGAMEHFHVIDRKATPQPHFLTNMMRFVSRWRVLFYYYRGRSH